MNITVILTAAVVVVGVSFFMLVVNRQKKEKWLREASVIDVVNHELFESNMRIVLDELNNQRARDEVKAEDRGGRLKSHPIEKLIDEGVFNSKDMVELFTYCLHKTLIGYSQRERQFIRDVGMMAYNRTMIQLQRQAGMKGGAR